MLTLEGTTMHRQMMGMHNKSLCFQLQWKNAIEEEKLFAFRKRKILSKILFLNCDNSPEVGWRDESFVQHSTHCGNTIAKCYNVHTNRRNLCPILYCPKQTIQKPVTLRWLTVSASKEASQMFGDWLYVPHKCSVTDCMCLTNVRWLTVCASQMFGDWLYVPHKCSVTDCMCLKWPHKMFGDWLYVPQMASQNVRWLTVCASNGLTKCSVTDCMCLKWPHKCSVTDCMCLTNVRWLTVCASQMFGDWLSASQMFGDWL